MNGDYRFTQQIANAVVEKYRSHAENSNTIHLKGMPLVTMQDGMKEKNREFNSACEIPFYSIFIKYDGRLLYVAPICFKTFQLEISMKQFCRR